MSERSLPASPAASVVAQTHDGRDAVELLNLMQRDLCVAPRHTIRGHLVFPVGSDAAGPCALGASIDGITSAAFLDDRQKRAILCENAARFFRLTTRPGQ